MYLLHVQELKVKEFNDHTRPPYAILSHTWGDEEVSFQDIGTPEVVSMAGYAKVLKCCEIAKRDGFEYVWIDTCCINKTSSAELSEAINAMFTWYSTASVCYVFLSDVKEVDGHDRAGSEFRLCRWFTRGWTLQELLAPKIIVFYNQDWVDIGTKRTLQTTITEITSIPHEALVNADYIRKVSIAARMSWVSGRRTTRTEDMAYCLMGIFDVNMPPLYGEGKKSFIRLQLEIMKDSHDESIFAWSSGRHIDWNGRTTPDCTEVSLLADTPLKFEYCRGVTCIDRNQPKPPFTMSNRGLHIWLPGIRKRLSLGYDLLLAGLDCVLPDGRHIGIVLQIESGSEKCIRAVAAAFAIEGADEKAMGNPKEMYIVPNAINFNPDYRDKYQPRSSSTFSFTDNANPHTGYRLCNFYDGQVHSGVDKAPSSRLCRFSAAKYGFDNFHMMYLVVQSVLDPAIHATVVLGMVQLVNNTPEHHCRVFFGSKIPSELTRFANSFNSSNRRQNYAEFFSWRDSENNSSHTKKFVYYPNDKIIKGLGSDWVLTITVRAGPSTAQDGTFLVSSYHFCVLIEFSRMSLGERLSDAEG